MIIHNFFPVNVLMNEDTRLLPIAEDIFNNFDFKNFKDLKYQTSFFDQSTFPQVEGIDRFKLALEESASFLAERQGVNLNQFKVVITNIWVNRMYEGGSHPRHGHAGSIYSGTYYVHCPKDCASIRFHNSLTDLWNMSLPPVGPNRVPSLAEYIDYSPAPGTMVIWNSWLGHEVLMNHSSEPRDTISFNFTCVEMV